MALSYLNDGFFSRLETLALNLRADLVGFFGGKALTWRAGTPAGVLPGFELHAVVY